MVLQTTPPSFIYQLMLQIELYKHYMFCLLFVFIRQSLLIL